MSHISPSEITIADSEADSCIADHNAVTKFAAKVNVQPVNYERIARRTITFPALYQSCVREVGIPINSYEAIFDDWIILWWSW